MFVGVQGESDEEDSRQTVLLGKGLPKVDECFAVGDVLREVYSEKRVSIPFDIPFVEECRQDGIEMLCVVFFSAVGLFDENFAVFQSMVKALPGFVGLGKAEGEIGFAGGNDFIERALQKLLAVAKPVMPVAEAVDAILCCQAGLFDACLWNTEIIVA